MNCAFSLRRTATTNELQNMAKTFIEYASLWLVFPTQLKCQIGSSSQEYEMVIYHLIISCPVKRATLHEETTG